MSENVIFTCPACSFQKHIPAKFVGQKGKCPGCQQVVLISAAPAKPTPAPSNRVTQNKADPLGTPVDDPLGLGPGLQNEGFGGMPASGGTVASPASDAMAKQRQKEMAGLQGELKAIRHGTVVDHQMGINATTAANISAASHNNQIFGLWAAGGSETQVQSAFDRKDTAVGALDAVALHMATSIEKGLRRQKSLEWLADERHGFPTFVTRWGRVFPILVFLTVVQTVAVVVSFGAPMASLIIAVVAGVIAHAVMASLKSLARAINSYPHIRDVGPTPFRESRAYIPICIGLQLVELGIYAFLIMRLISSLS
jgi:hypothetical protein